MFQTTNQSINNRNDPEIWNSTHRLPVFFFPRKTPQKSRAIRVPSFEAEKNPGDTLCSDESQTYPVSESSETSSFRAKTQFLRDLRADGNSGFLGQF